MPAEPRYRRIGQRNSQMTNAERKASIAAIKASARGKLIDRDRREDDHERAMEKNESLVQEGPMAMMKGIGRGAKKVAGVLGRELRDAIVAKGELSQQAANITKPKSKKNESVVSEYLESYFGGELNESTSDEDIMEAFDELLETADAVAEYLNNLPT